MFKNQYGAQWQLMMAASAVALLPIIILFFFTQRTFVQGITMTGVKG
jgi:multiple sugar transport system permease protein